MRREALANWCGSLADGNFAWVTTPLLNPYTRLAVAMNARDSVLQVTGYEPTDSDLPGPVATGRIDAALKSVPLR